MEVGVSVSSDDNRGKHRIMAELKRLDQETRFLQKELESIEMLEKSSHACQELVHNVECNADPLLPVTIGQSNSSWDRWFEGPQDTKGCGYCGCWLL